MRHLVRLAVVGTLAVVALVFAGAGLAACGGGIGSSPPSTYSGQFEETFLQACEGSDQLPNAVAACQCVLTRMERQYTQAQAAQINIDVGNGKPLPAQVNDDVAACANA